MFARAMKKMLQADPDCRLLSADLSGTLGLNLTEWAVSVVFVPEPSGLNVLDAREYTEPPDVSVSGRVSDFIGLFARESSSMVKTQVKIEGDIRLLAKYQQFFKRWKFDLGHVIAQVLGEEAARFCYAPLKKMSDFLKNQKQERFQDLKEIVYEEKRWLVPKDELEDFYAELKMLQLRVDRLVARSLVH